MSLCDPASLFWGLTQKWGCQEFRFYFLRNIHTFARRLLPPTVHGAPVPLHPCQHVFAVGDSCPDGREVMSRRSLACVSLMVGDVGHLPVCLWAVRVSLEKCLVQVLSWFLNHNVCFLLFSCRSSLYILYICVSSEI